jgi:hypothetical protein
MTDDAVIRTEEEKPLPLCRPSTELEVVGHVEGNLRTHDPDARVTGERFGEVETIRGIVCDNYLQSRGRDL